MSGIVEALFIWEIEDGQFGNAKAAMTTRDFLTAAGTNRSGSGGRASDELDANKIRLK